jgi:hypothetical protein
VTDWFAEVDAARERKYKGEPDGEQNEAVNALVVGDG